MTPLVWLALAATALIVGFRLAGQARRHRLEQLRATWGVPSPREHRLEEMLQSHRSRVASRGESVALDDRTWDDLVLDEVFTRVDYTESTLGRHALYHRLRGVHTADSLRAFESLVTRLGVDADLRERAQLALGRLRDPQGYDLWWLAGRDAVVVPRWYAIFPILALAILVLVPVVFWRPDLLPVLVGVLITSFVTQLPTIRRIDGISRAFRQIAPLVATGQALRFVHGDDIDPLVASIRRHTPSLLPLKTISRWISGDPLMLSAQASPVAAMVADLVTGIYDYLNLVLPVNAAGTYLGIARLRADAAALLDVVVAVGDVDSALSVASFRAGHTVWSRPVFVAPGSDIVMTGAIHPLVAGAVPNSLELRPGTGVLVTGSNMSGKSTLLRTLGVTAVMAQSLHTCLAAAYTAPVLSVLSCIGRADDILQGKSYYLVEVEALLGLVRASTGSRPHLFLLDEMFRGTNAVERIAAGQSVLIELVSGKPHVAVAATHDSELVDLLSGSYEAFHFGDALTDEALTFDYRLRPGRATSRNAIALLRLNGAPPALVERALVSAAELERHRTIA